MYLIDFNVLLYAFRSEKPLHWQSQWHTTTDFLVSATRRFCRKW